MSAQKTRLEERFRWRSLPQPLRCVGLLGWVLACLVSLPVSAQQVPERYEQYIQRFPQNQSLLEETLNRFGLTNEEVGPGFALVVGVDFYPQLKGREELKPAGVDLDKLVAYLEGQERFQEIVVLRNEAVTLENLDYFLKRYFPKQLERVPGKKGRFLLAFSGHGVQEGVDGYLLEPDAKRFDPEFGISFSVIKGLYRRILQHSHQSLVLINACHSGAFLERESYGQMIPRDPGHWAITAGGSVDELVWHDAAIGPGSIFFEKLFAALDGRADTLPYWEEGPSGDGLVTVEELFAYLKSEVQIATRQSQTPRMGNISIHGDQGSFFFFDHDRKVIRKTGRTKVPPSERRTSFGSVDCPNGKTCLDLAAHQARRDNLESANAFLYRACSLGDLTGCTYLGLHFYRGLGVEQDYVEAARFFGEACEAGGAVACASLGVMYRDGVGVTQDLAEAVRLSRLGCDGGTALGCSVLGHLFESGFGVDADLSEAARFYRLGCDGGDAMGCANLGTLFSEGSGVDKDSAEAFRYFTLACSGGDARGCSSLGNLYERGEGVDADKGFAKLFYQQGCDAGDAWGCEQVERLQ
ncbi:MAG: caspase family protein [Acidobacteriota bacterium]